jgi:hypothetical protein
MERKTTLHQQVKGFDDTGSIGSIAAERHQRLLKTLSEYLAP